MSTPAEPLQAAQMQVQALLAELRPLAVEAAAAQPAWVEHLDRLEDLAQFLASGGRAVQVSRATHPRIVGRSDLH
jgi:hypothetical protein